MSKEEQKKAAEEAQRAKEEAAEQFDENEEILRSTMLILTKNKKNGLLIKYNLTDEKQLYSGQDARLGCSCFHRNFFDYAITGIDIRAELLYNITRIQNKTLYLTYFCKLLIG